MDATFFYSPFREAMRTFASPTTNTATLFGQIVWDGLPVIDDDEGGTAGVREPRRPLPSGPPPAAVALAVA